MLFQSVLLVEDDDAHALLIERALKGVVGAVDRRSLVADGCRGCSKGGYDLIVSDLNLPDERGENVVHALRERAPKTPIIVLTSSATVVDGVAAMKAGASDFLVKNFDGTFRDVLGLALSRIRQMQDAEREREELMRDRDVLLGVLENSNDGFAVLRHDGKVRYCNSAFRAFLSGFGGSPDDAFALDRGMVSRGEDLLPKWRERIEQLEAGGVVSVELSGVGEAELACSVSVAAVRDGANGIALVMWIRDIREQRRRERFQREILSTTTHDLKGPLGAISVSCDVLLGDGKDNDRAHALIERIASSANSAIHLIDELLSAKRIEEGALFLKPSRHDIRGLIDEVVRTFTLSARTKGIELSFVSDEAEVYACVDPLGFERVISNLLSNALKFTGKGGAVVLRVGRVTDGAVISVEDSGQGLEPSDAQRLFQRFSRLSQHAAVSGTGLGLFIVKSIVSAHGGTIDLSSAVGKGSTFEVFFPDSPPLNERGEVLCVDCS